MKDFPLVSVIVPFYGVEDYIARCAESLLRQTYPAIQYIFVNDGSRDRSAEVLSSVLERFPERNVLLLSHENIGLPRTRAAGLLKAEGKYVMHVDSDDWVEPDAVERLVACAEENDADLVHFDFWKEYGTRTRLDREKPYTEADKETWMRRLYRDRAYGYLWNKFARRELYEGIFVPRYNMHEDIVVATQLIWRCRRAVHLPVPLLHYRRDNAGAATREGKKKRRGQSARNFLDFYEWGRDHSEVAVVRNDILLRAAWVAFSMDRDLFRERPYLKEEARHLPLMTGHRVLPGQQLVLKTYLNL